MNEWLVLGTVFLIVGAGCFLVVHSLTGAGRQIDQRLSDIANGDRQLILGDLTMPLGEWAVSGNGKKKADLIKELRAAGYYRKTALLEFAALRTLLVAGPLFAAIAVAVTSPSEFVPWAVGAGLLLALLGYSLPRAIVGYQAKQRGRQIERGLPVAVDLLSLCLTGGQNLLTALERVSHDLQYAFPVLSQELRIVYKHAEMAGLEMALKSFADRTNVPEVKNLTIMLTHVERLGSDVAAALFEFSTNFRQSLRLRAESYANRVSFWVLFPTIMCLLVPGVLLFYAPLLYEASRLRSELREDLQNSQKTLNKLEAPKRSQSK